jgi:hypothetical protein
MNLKNQLCFIKKTGESIKLFGQKSTYILHHYLDMKLCIYFSQTFNNIFNRPSLLVNTKMFDKKKTKLLTKLSLKIIRFICFNCYFTNIYLMLFIGNK